MAVVNPSLIPFIEMLAELGIDWLAVELFDGIRRGQEPMEEDDALAQSRPRARAKQVEELPPGFHDSVAAEPLVGHRQLEWAADYVYARVEATLAEMSASISALDEIVASDSEGQVRRTSASVTLVLRDGDANAEEGRSTSRTDVEAARAKLSELRSVLDAWLDSNQSDTDQ